MSTLDPYQWIASVASSDPSRPCLSDRNRHLSYAEVDQRAGLQGAALRRLGVRSGDRIAVQIDKSLDAVLAYLACLRIGAVLVPLNTAYTSSELEYFLTDSEPTLLLTRPEFAAEAASVARRCRCPQVETLGVQGSGSFAARVAAETLPAPIATLPGDALASLLYTSGTTGRSKGAMLTRANLLENAQALVATWQMSAQDVLVHVLPLFHVHGLFLSLNVLFAAGGSVRVLQRFDPAETVSELSSASVFMGVPTHYTRLLACPALTRTAVAAVRLFVSGSAPLLADTHRQFQERTGKAIVERYGMTETLVNTSNPFRGVRKAGSVGLPLPGVELRIADTAGSGEHSAVGMIEIRGPNVCTGYWRAPDKSAADRTADGFFRTGDLGAVDADGYVSIVGRAKDLVITGGYNVYPKEIELELDALPEVVESAVFGVPHPDLGEGVTAAITLKPGTAIIESALIHALRTRLAAYKVPKRILVLEELPRNTMGKVQKNRLREDHRDLYRG